MTCSLLGIPIELSLNILSLLTDPQDICNFGRSCRALNDIARSDEVWRDRVEELVRTHARKKSDIDCMHWRPGDAIYANYVQPLLSTGAKYLGVSIRLLRYLSDGLTKLLGQVGGQPLRCIEAASAEFH